MKDEAGIAKSTKPEKDYEAENAVDTLQRAHEIKADKHLMGRVKKHAGRKLAALKGLHNDIRSIDDIRDAYDKKYGVQKSCMDCGTKMKQGSCPDCGMG